MGVAFEIQHGIDDVCSSVGQPAHLPSVMPDQDQAGAVAFGVTRQLRRHIRAPVPRCRVPIAATRCTPSGSRSITRDIRLLPAAEVARIFSTLDFRHSRIGRRSIPAAMPRSAICCRLFALTYSTLCCWPGGSACNAAASICDTGIAADQHHGTAHDAAACTRSVHRYRCRWLAPPLPRPAPATAPRWHWPGRQAARDNCPESTRPACSTDRNRGTGLAAGRNCPAFAAAVSCFCLGHQPAHAGEKIDARRKQRGTG